MRMAKGVGAKDQLNRPEERTTATLVGHFAYGAAAGGLYPLIAGKIASPGWLRGILYGGLVWLVSYMGWVPAANLLPSPTDTPTRRNILMITAHVVYGATLGWVASIL